MVLNYHGWLCGALHANCCQFSSVLCLPQRLCQPERRGFAKRVSIHRSIRFSSTLESGCGLGETRGAMAGKESRIRGNSQSRRQGCFRTAHPARQADYQRVGCPQRGGRPQLLLEVLLPSLNVACRQQFGPCGIPTHAATARAASLALQVSVSAELLHAELHTVVCGLGTMATGTRLDGAERRQSGLGNDWNRGCLAEHVASNGLQRGRDPGLHSWPGV